MKQKREETEAEKHQRREQAHLADLEWGRGCNQAFDYKQFYHGRLVDLFQLVEAVDRRVHRGKWTGEKAIGFLREFFSREGHKVFAGDSERDPDVKDVEIERLGIVVRRLQIRLMDLKAENAERVTRARSLEQELELEEVDVNAKEPKVVLIRVRKDGTRI